MAEPGGPHMGWSDDAAPAADVAPSDTAAPGNAPRRPLHWERAAVAAVVMLVITVGAMILATVL